MEKFTSILLAELNNDLQKIAVTAENRLQQAERSFKIADQAMARLRDFIAAYKFKSSEEEIKFFKQIKPEFQKELVYNEEVLYIESNCPVGPNKARKIFIERTLNRIQAYFEKHSFIYNYCRSGETSLDTTFFVRSPRPIPLTPVSFSDSDPQFSNPHSYKVAKMKALEDLRIYIANKIEATHEIKLEQQTTSDQKTDQKCIFTGPKAALEETLHAWIAKGWINYGDYAAQRLFHNAQSWLQVKLSDPARSLIGMSLRKNSYTPHIDTMKDALIEKIERKHQ